MSNESSVNLIISTFLGERRLFMDNIRLSNPNIRLIYGVYSLRKISVSIRLPGF